MNQIAIAAAAVALLLACRHAPAVPLDRPLWRLDGPWVNPRDAKVRTAPGAVIVFRSSGEFVEHHCHFIEQPDTTVYIASGGVHVVVVGTWKQDGADITATRQKIFRTGSSAAKDPLCDQPRLKFHIDGNSVTGNAGQQGQGSYAPVTRLVAPDFESYVNEAKRSSVTCGSTSKD